MLQSHKVTVSGTLLVSDAKQERRKCGNWCDGKGGLWTTKFSGARRLAASSSARSEHRWWPWARSCVCDCHSLGRIYVRTVQDSFTSFLCKMSLRRDSLHQSPSTIFNSTFFRVYGTSCFLQRAGWSWQLVQLTRALPPHTSSTDYCTQTVLSHSVTPQLPLCQQIYLIHTKYCFNWEMEMKKNKGGKSLLRIGWIVAHAELGVTHKTVQRTLASPVSWFQH